MLGNENDLKKHKCSYYVLSIVRIHNIYVLKRGIY